MSGDTDMSAPRTIDVDGREFTFTLNTPFPSLIVREGDGLPCVVPTGGETRFSNQQLRKIARTLLAAG